MKTFQSTLAILMLALFSMSCSKNDDSNKPASIAANTLTFKGKSIVFNSLSVDDAASNGTSEYIFTTLSDLSLVFYCKYLSTVQGSSVGTVTYTTDAVDFQPVNNYPQLTIRGYINFDNLLYKTISGQVKIKRNATGNQSIEFVNLKLKAGTDEQLLNGTINLPKS